MKNLEFWYNDDQGEDEEEAEVQTEQDAQPHPEKPPVND